MKVFVTGATGLIGNAVARALRRAGHTVYGLVRSKDKALLLEQDEIIPAHGDLQSFASFKETLASCGAIIHTAFDHTSFPQSDTLVVETVISGVKYATAQRPVFIYTSGVLVTPDRSTRGDFVDEYSEPNNPPLTARIENEKKVLNATSVHGVVIRPGYVFGKTAPHHSSVFEQAKKGEVKVPAASHVYSYTHIDDLAEAYVRAAESPNAVSGHILNVTDDNRFTELELAKALAKAAGFSGPVVADDTNLWPPSNKSVPIDWRKTGRLLNWYPRHLPIGDEAYLYYASWKAQQK